MRIMYKNIFKYDDMKRSSIWRSEQLQGGISGHTSF